MSEATTNASIAELVEEALVSGRELAREEVRLALAEGESDLAAVRRAIALWLVASGAFGAALSSLGMTLVLALDLGALGAGIVAGLGGLLAALATWLGARAMPSAPFARSRSRIERRVDHVKEALT